MYYATFRQFLTIKTIEERYRNVQYSPMIFNNYFIVLLIPDLELFGRKSKQFLSMIYDLINVVNVYLEI